VGEVELVHGAPPVLSGLSVAHGAGVFQTMAFRSCERAARLPRSSAGVVPIALTG
jgi:hypothetical protein